MIDLERFEDAHQLTVAGVALAMRVPKMTVYRLVHARAVKEYVVGERRAAAPAALTTATWSRGSGRSGLSLARHSSGP